MWEDNKFLPILELVFRKPGKVDKINPPETEAAGILVPIHWWLENWWWTEHLNVSSCIKHGRDMKHLIYAAKRKIQNWVEYIFFCKNLKVLVFCWKHLCAQVHLFLAMTCGHGSEFFQTTARILKFLVTLHSKFCMQFSGSSYCINCLNTPEDVISPNSVFDK